MRLPCDREKKTFEFYLNVRGVSKSCTLCCAVATMKNRRRLLLLIGLGVAVVVAIIFQSRSFSKLMRKVPVPAFYEDFVLSDAFRGPPSGTPYFTITRNDRSGMVITDMLNAWAYCFRMNRIYAGSCPAPDRTARPPHEAEAKAILQSLGLYYNKSRPDGSPLRFLHSCPTNESEAVRLNRDWYDTHGTHKAWVPAFTRRVQALVEIDRKSLLRNDNDTSGEELDERYIVAVHIRRGDVHPCRHQGRYLPDSHYLRLLDLYLPSKYRNMTKHKVYVFSQKWSFENFSSFEASPYNVELALDTDLSDVWQTMAIADLVLLSKSTFSLVPAMLNGRGTIIYTRFPRSRLPGWVLAPEELILLADTEVKRMADEYCDKPAFNPWLNGKTPV